MSMSFCLFTASDIKIKEIVTFSDCVMHNKVEYCNNAICSNPFISNGETSITFYPSLEF